MCLMQAAEAPGSKADLTVSCHGCEVEEVSMHAAVWHWPVMLHVFSASAKRWWSVQVSPSP